MKPDTLQVIRLSINRTRFGRAYYWRRVAWALFRTVLLAGLIYVLIYPILFVLSASLKTYNDLIDPTTIWIPKHPTLVAYAQAFVKIGYLEAFKNSLFISSLTAVLQVAACSIIGYGFARFRFRERNLLFALVVFTMIVPPQTMIIPQFILYKDLKILNTYYPFILPTIFGMGLKGGLFIYIFRQFFRGMPKELEDSAYIDGCGPFQTYLKIMLPNAIPAITTVFLFSFVWHWNDIFEPSVYLHTFDKYTLPMRLANIQQFIIGTANIPDPLVVFAPKNAGVFLIILPMLLLYLIGQRYFVESVERTGIVG